MSGNKTKVPYHARLRGETSWNRQDWEQKKAKPEANPIAWEMTKPGDTGVSGYLTHIDPEDPEDIKRGASEILQIFYRLGFTIKETQAIIMVPVDTTDTNEALLKEGKRLEVNITLREGGPQKHAKGHLEAEAWEIDANQKRIELITGPQPIKNPKTAKEKMWNLLHLTMRRLFARKSITTPVKLIDPRFAAASSQAQAIQNHMAQNLTPGRHPEHTRPAQGNGPKQKDHGL